MITKQKTPARESEGKRRDKFLSTQKYKLGSGMKQQYIENCMRGWVQEYRESEHRWYSLKELLEKRLPELLTEDTFEAQFVRAHLEAEKMIQAKCKRKMRWLGKLHDEATDQKRFTPKPVRGRVDTAALKERVDCRDLAERYFECKRRGKYAVASCPFHQERTPSFYAYQDGFKCFGCQWSGDCLKFVQEMDKCDFVTALQKVRDV